MSDGPPTAWLVEDSHALALLITRQLQSLGYAVQHVDAEAVLQQQAPAPAALLVALVGQNSNGFRLLRHMKALRCPRILLTASGRDTDFGWGLRAGATAVLRWPPGLSQLQEALSAAKDSRHE